MVERTMARKPRLEFEGAFYHVLTRGNQKQDIFRDKQDYKKYLQIVGDYKSRYPFLLYAYALMPNHVHLLVEREKTPLSKILQGINQRYTMFFNWKYETVGHIFQGRYKAILCDKEEYLSRLIMYIHNNPVRAGIAEELDDYPWTSHRLFLKPKKDAIADVRMSLGFFHEDLGKAVGLYRKSMEQEGISKKELEKTVDQRILGDVEFVGKILDKEQGKVFPRKRKHEFDLEDIAGGIQEALGIDAEKLKGKERSAEIKRARAIFIWIAHEYGYKGLEIAEYLMRDPSSIAKYSHQRENLEETLKKVFSALESKN